VEHRHDLRAPVCRLPQHLHHLQLVVGIEGGYRLIGHQGSRLDRERTRQQHAHPFTAR
jgi:hypothetical protein